MKKYLLIFFLASQALADTNIVWRLPYIRPYLLMRGTNSHQYDTCWEFINEIATNSVGILVTNSITNYSYPTILTTINSNFTFTTSNHIAGRTYYYNSAEYVRNSALNDSYMWITNNEILIQQTNIIVNSNLARPKGLLIFEHW